MSIGSVVAATRASRTPDADLPAPKSRASSQSQKDDAQLLMSPLQLKFDYVLTHGWFEPVIGSVIFFNFIVVCLETDLGAHCSRMEDEGCLPGWIGVANNVLLAIYTVEIAARIFAYRLALLYNPWALFDLFIVTFGYVDIIATSISDSSIPGMGMLRVFRVARLLRTARVLKFFPTLNSMLRGFINAMSAMWIGFVGILFLLIMWAVLFVNFVDPVNQILDHSHNEYCRDAFRSIFRSILLLFQCLVAGDSWGACAIPVVIEEPTTFAVFSGALITIQLGFTNLILATIVERASEASAMDRDESAAEELRQKQEKKLEAQEKLLEVCKAIDSDGQGTITLEELMNGYDSSEEFQTCCQMLELEKKELEGFFNLVDEDKSGDLTYTELIESLHKADTQELRKQIINLKIQISDIRHQIMRLGRGLNLDDCRSSGGLDCPATDIGSALISRELGQLQMRITRELSSMARHVAEQEAEQHMRFIKLQDIAGQGDDYPTSHAWPLQNGNGDVPGWHDPQSAWGVSQEQPSIEGASSPARQQATTDPHMASTALKRPPGRQSWQEAQSSWGVAQEQSCAEGFHSPSGPKISKDPHLASTALKRPPGCQRC